MNTLMQKYKKDYPNISADFSNELPASLNKYFNNHLHIFTRIEKNALAPLPVFVGYDLVQPNIVVH
ncbi:MAG: hypothetical protein AB8B66_05595 [Rickettsiaceae bacterium]